MDISHVIHTEQANLASQWSNVLVRLQFQLPVLDERGWPANVHLLDTLRQAVAIYGQMAALDHVRESVRVLRAKAASRLKNAG